jgi:molybdenum cofactor cytidylyltransferase
MTPILILAAGQSARMRGRDKLLEPVDGAPLLVRQVQTALAVTPDVCVVLPAADHPRARLLAPLPVTILVAPDASEGMSASLRSGIGQLPPFDRVMILLADLPELTAQDLGAVLSAARNDTDNVIWRGVGQDGRPGHPILFDNALRAAFAGLSGDKGGQAIAAAHRARTVLVPLPANHALRDLDTPEDWAQWRIETGR